MPRKAPATKTAEVAPVDSAEVPETPEPASEENAVTSVAESTSSSGGLDWGALLGSVETDELKPRLEPVEAPGELVQLLISLDQPGANGGKKRAKLPVSSLEDFKKIQRTLRAAAEKLPEPRSVTSRGVYRPEDQMVQENPETGRKQTVVKDGAVPTHISFTVGARRGAKPGSGAHDDDEESDD